MKKLRTLPPETCGARLSRRTAIRQVGGWTIYLGALTVAACGRTPLGEPLGGFIGDDDDDDAGTTVTPTPTLSPTPTPEPCTCDPISGAPLSLNVSMLPVNSFAVKSGLQIFVCHDAAGFYAMSDLCTHAGNHILNNGTFNTANLANGFRCNYHGSTFDGNGLRSGGPAPAGSYLFHYLVTIDGSGELYIDQTKLVEPSCRCNPA
jgi:Rieske Fe-S protein